MDIKNVAATGQANTLKSLHRPGE